MGNPRTTSSEPQVNGSNSSRAPAPARRQSHTPTHCFFGAESLSPGNGGIAQLARLMARVIGGEVAAGRLLARGTVLSDPAVDNEFGFPIRTARKCRARFVWETHRAALRSSCFLYDFLGIARAHCRLPLLRQPYLVWMCGVEIWEGARPDRIRAARGADLLLAISAYTLERAERLHSGLQRAAVCWLGTESDDPLPPRRLPGGPPTVLIIGRLRRERDKGHSALISSWPKVASALPGARLVVVGTGPDLDSFRAEARASPVANRIEFRGFVPHEKMDDIWAEADVFAMPSRGEGFGFVYIEAMRHGVPVVASVHDAAPEVNLDGQTGYNVDLDEGDELADRLIHLLRDPDHAAALGRSGRSRWAEHFRYSAFRERFLPLLREFVGA
jgi:phosphatidylinositol alpha-1,6-mannosyltransferase